MKSSRCSFPRTQHDECNFLLLSDHAPSHVVQQVVCLVCRESDCSLTFTLAPTATPGLWQQDCCLDSFLPVCSNARHNHNPDTEWVRRKLKDDSITMGGSSLISLIRFVCPSALRFSHSACQQLTFLLHSDLGWTHEAKSSNKKLHTFITVTLVE